MAEKRFDVRVPEENTAVLEALADESRRTGVAEGRLIVVWLTRYVEMTKGGSFPLIFPGQANAVQVPSNGHHERDLPSGIEPLLNNDILNSFMDED